MAYLSCIVIFLLIQSLSSFQISKFQSFSRYFSQSKYTLFATKQTSTSKTNEVIFNKIFIGNLPFTITDKDIQKLIDENVGEGLVKNIQIAMGKKSKAPRGFCFVELIDEDAASTAASILNEVTYQDRLLNSNVKDDEGQNSDPSVNRRKARVVANTVFITNLDTTLDQSEVLQMCNDIIGVDTVISLQMPLDIVTKRPRGMAFVGKIIYEYVIYEYITILYAILYEIQI